MDDDKTKSTARLKKTKGDVAHTVIRAGLSAVPVVGGPLVEVFAAIVAEPLSRRRDSWIEELATSLKDLEGKVDGFKVEALKDNPAFLTVVAHAGQAVIRTHQQEKRDALRNAVLNVAAGTAPDDDLQLIFLHLIERFTPWHLRLLALLQDPRGNERAVARAQGMMTGALVHILEAAYPELVGQRAFYDLLMKDLRDAGLTNTESLHGMMTAGGLLQKRTTDIGDAFVRFVTDPL